MTAAFPVVGEFLPREGPRCIKPAIFHDACKAGDVNAILFTLSLGSTSIDAQDGDGATGLHWAAYNGHVEAVKLLVERGASVDARTGTEQTPYHWAAISGHVLIMHMLKGAGADTRAVDNQGSNAAHLAAMYHQQLALFYALGEGLDIDSQGLLL